MNPNSIAPSVLVVDDEESIRRLVVTWLSKWGLQVRSAVSANDALEQMSANPASILFCDVMMPVHDGLWLAEQVRSRWPNTAIVMASGASDMQTVLASRKHGAIAYVTKPFGREMLRQAIDSASRALSPTS
jgi:CheY-like chemotaxis protein